jgi:hypothetical protein
MSYTYEDIAAKAEYEGGLDEALDWFEVDEIPEDIRMAWTTARAHKLRLEHFLDKIWTHFPEELQ